MRHAIAAAMTLALSCTATGQPFLVKDGQPQAEIVISDNAVPVVKLAASELQTYIAKLSGATLPIATTPSRDVPVQIYVRRSAHTERLKLTDDGLRHGAFRMASGENWLVLVGRDTSFTPKEPHLRNHGDWPRLTAEWDKLTGEKWGYPHTPVHKQFNKELGIWEQDERGSFNAVCHFLHEQGVRWYLPDALGEIVPKKPIIALPQVSKTVRPGFALRYPYQYMKRFSMASRDEILWQLRLGFNQAPDLVGVGGFAHGTNHAHQRPEVKAAHPEYFALWGGQRATEHPGSGAPCLSSKGLFEQNVKFVRAVFDIFDAPLESVMPADGYVSLCQCDLCKGKDTPERGWNGQISDYVWDCVNRVAQELYKTHPNKKVLAFWANSALHIGIRCDDPDAKNLVIGATKPDDTNVWNGDCVEVLIETQTHSYYQLAISPSGALMDLDRKSGLNTKWSSRAEVASHIGENFWSLEVRIPVAGDLQGDVDPLNGVAGRKPTSTYPWYFNVCRQRVRQKDMELSAFSPTGKRVFHDLMKFAELWMQ